VRAYLVPLVQQEQELAGPQVRLAPELQVRLVLLELVVSRGQQELLELVALPELQVLELPVLLVLLELVVLQVPQVLVLRELQGPLALLELAGLPEQPAPELLELLERLVLLELAEPLVPRVRAYLVPLVPQVQEYLAQRVQQELVLRVPLVLAELLVPREQLAPE
jgi:hypothetical protein